MADLEWSNAASHLEALSEDAAEMGLPCLSCLVNLIEEGDEFVVGTYVPELYLVVRRVEPDEDTT